MTGRIAPSRGRLRPKSPRPLSVHGCRARKQSGRRERFLAPALIKDLSIGTTQEDLEVRLVHSPASARFSNFIIAS